LENKKNLWQLLAGVSGLCGVIAGALGAHAVANGAAAALIEKASYYQLLHSAVLLMLAGNAGRFMQFARMAFLAGIILFCGSLYFKGFGQIASAPLAPMGGMLLMLGWGVGAAGGLCKGNG